MSPEVHRTPEVPGQGPSRGIESVVEQGSVYDSVPRVEELKELLALPAIKS